MQVAHDHLSILFAALADPTRRAILEKLTSGETTVQELAEPFADMSLPNVSKHLKVLENAGLIEKSRDKQWRPCRIKAEGFKDVSDWLDHYRHFWEESLDRLDVYLQTLKSKENKDKVNDD